jgi:hypothetical protein
METQIHNFQPWQVLAYSPPAGLFQDPLQELLPVQQHCMKNNIHRHQNVDGIILDRYLQYVFLSA